MTDLRPATFDDCGTPGTVIYDGHMWHTHCPDCGAICHDHLSRLVTKRLDEHQWWSCPERAQ